MINSEKQQIEPLVNIQEAARYLGCRENSIRIWVIQKRIPFLKVGSRLRFRLSKLERWAEENAK